MNRKNLVLLSKCALLFAFLGFCIPTFDSSEGKINGFYPIVKLLPSGLEDYEDSSNSLKDYESSDVYKNNQVILAEKEVAVNKSFDDIKANYKNNLELYREIHAPLSKVVKQERKKVDSTRKSLEKLKVKVVNQEKHRIKDVQKNLKKGLSASSVVIEDKIDVIGEVSEILGLSPIDVQNSFIDLKVVEANLGEGETRESKLIDSYLAGIYLKNEDVCKYLNPSYGTFSSEELNSINTLIFELSGRDSVADITDNDRKSSVIKIVDNGKKLFRKNKNSDLRSAWNDYKKECEEYNIYHEELVANKKIAVNEIVIPILLILFVCSIVVSVLFTTIKFVTLKKSLYSKADQVLDVILYIIMFGAAIFAFNKLQKIDLGILNGVTFIVGFYFIVIGLVVSLLLYLFSMTLDENISSKSEERRAYWMLSLPAILFYFAVMTFPAVFSVALSFTDYGGGPLFDKFSMFFIGFDNYTSVFKDEIFYISLKNNFYVVLISVFGQLPLGFLLAYVLNRGLVKGRDFYQTMIYLPCVISTVVIGILFQSFFSARGAWTDIMKFFNPEYQWTRGAHPMLPVLFVILWMYTGTYLIIFLANLQKLDPGIIEAATIDGATEGQVLWHVIFPELSGTFVISSILAISGSLKSFDLIYVMTQGGPAKQTYVLSLYMFDKAFTGAADYPMANTISTIMVVISLVLIAVVKTLEKKFGATEE